ncbi:hypothetical protein DFH11DRAFT_1539642 [Phellopilus nigrolimitatus]|nr:hypothetical protein DFH11DRAFT_1539642 [Phellopilus nigrolimitatus]
MKNPVLNDSGGSMILTGFDDAALGAMDANGRSGRDVGKAWPRSGAGSVFVEAASGLGADASGEDRAGACRFCGRGLKADTGWALIVAVVVAACAKQRRSTSSRVAENGRREGERQGRGEC